LLGISAWHESGQFLLRFCPSKRAYLRLNQGLFMFTSHLPSHKMPVISPNERP
jgi:hypothetical protein